MTMIRAGAIGSAVVVGTLGDLGRVASHAIVRGWRELRQRRRDRITRRVLDGLDDRTLRDIGIDRSEIASAVATRSRQRRYPEFGLM